MCPKVASILRCNVAITRNRAFFIFFECSIEIVAFLVLVGVRSVLDGFGNRALACFLRAVSSSHFRCRQHPIKSWNSPLDTLPFPTRCDLASYPLYATPQKTGIKIALEIVTLANLLNGIEKRVVAVFENLPSCRPSSCQHLITCRRQPQRSSPSLCHDKEIPSSSVQEWASPSSGSSTEISRDVSTRTSSSSLGQLLVVLVVILVNVPTSLPLDSSRLVS
jgi:hypothetical protein